MPFIFQIQSPHTEIDAQQVGVEDQCIENKATDEQLSISNGKKQYGDDFMEVKRTKIEKKKKSEQEKWRYSLTLSYAKMLNSFLIDNKMSKFRCLVFGY